MKKLLVLILLTIPMYLVADDSPVFRIQPGVKIVSDTSNVNKAIGRLCFCTSDSTLYIGDGTYLDAIMKCVDGITFKGITTFYGAASEQVVIDPDGLTFIAITATTAGNLKAIDLSGMTAISSSSDYWIYNNVNNHWRGDGVLTLSTVYSFATYANAFKPYTNSNLLISNDNKPAYDILIDIGANASGADGSLKMGDTGTAGEYCEIDSMGILRQSVTAGIAAVNPGGQGDGALTSNINEIATVGTADDAVTLPSAAAGMIIRIINNGANQLEIWPASGDNTGAGVNTAVTLAAGSNVTYIAYDATNWEQF